MHRSVLQRTSQQNKTIGIRGDYKVYTFFYYSTVRIKVNAIDNLNKQFIPFLEI